MPRKEAGAIEGSMNRKEYVQKSEFIILYLVFGAVLLFQYSQAFTYEETFLFIELILAYIWTAGLMVFAKIKFHLKIFEPVSMITVIYEGIFVVKPILDLRSHSMYEHGLSVLSGGSKATLLFILGYTAFYFSYYLRHRKITYNRHPIFHKKKNGILYDGKKVLFLYGAWIMVYGLCIICLVTQGLSLQYIFSFGAEGIREVDESNTALLFLSNFGVTLVTLWLMILEYSKNILIKVCTTVLCIVYILMRNARWLMLVFILAPVVLFYIKKNKEPKILWIVLIGATGLAVFAWMQANRAILAAGGSMQGWGKEGFTLEALLAPLETDLSTYRTFYSMVERFPAQYGYMFGSTFLYAFVLFVPRTIWAGKPDNPVRDMIEHSLNANARVSGTAVANIGEFYANFGTVGIIGFMYFLGWITASLKRFAFQTDDAPPEARDKQIIYAVLYPLLFQWIARGNFSGNLYLTVFAILPVLLPEIYRTLKKVE